MEKKRLSFSEQVKKELAGKTFTSENKSFNMENRRALLRDSFLRKGSMSDPKKAYHLEFVLADEEETKALQALLNSFEIRCKTARRKRQIVVYLKDGEDIALLLNVMGAHVSLMEMENERIYKDMRNAVNRRVNCDAANITKAVRASDAQCEAIRYLEAHGGLNQLEKPLRTAARLRLAHPDLTLQELAARGKPPMTKSGINHRLQRIMEIARQRKIKDREGDYEKDIFGQSGG